MEFLLIFFYIAVAVVVFIAWAQIFSKAGHSGWLCLLLIIPLVNIILFFWFAFSQWPVIRRSNIDRPLSS